MRLTPKKLFNGRLLVHPLPKREEEIGGIIHAASVNAELSEGRVVSVAGNITDVLQIGEIVLYPTASGAGQFFEGKHCLWLQITDIYGCVEDDDTQP